MERMKAGALLIVACMLGAFTGCVKKEVTDDSYIKGQLRNAADKVIYLKLLTEAGESTIDSVKTDDAGNFLLPNKATATDYYLLRVDNNNAVYLILSSGEKVEITGDANDLDNTYSVEGSKDSKLLQSMNRYDKTLSDSLFRVYKSMTSKTPSANDSLVAKFQQVYSNQMQNFVRNLIRQNMNSLVSLSATRYLDKEADINLFVELEQSLSKTFPGNKYVIDFSTVVAQLRVLPFGSIAPEINLPDPSGKMIALSSLKGKVVLIDFWASWCGPCRRENPNVVAMYKRYKPKGFEIYGVSLDDNKANWQEAIKADKITWLQVSELKKWDAEVVKAYHVEAIPFTVLIDREGKVVGKGLRGAELEQKIKAVL